MLYKNAAKTGKSKEKNGLGYLLAVQSSKVYQVSKMMLEASFLSKRRWIFNSASKITKASSQKKG